MLNESVVTVSRASLAPLATPRLSAAGLAVRGAASDETMERADLRRFLARGDAAIVTEHDVIDGDLLRRLPDLRVLASASARLDHVDLEAAHAQGIVVGAAAGAQAASTAELAFGLLLHLARSINVADGQVRRGFTDADIFTPGLQLAGQTMAVVGMGHVGRAVARRARAFGMSVLFTSRTSKPEIAERLRAEQVTIAEALQRADVVVVATALTADTHHLLDESAFSLMKPSAVLVNVAKGELVDEHALVNALANGRLAGAALDVFEREPHVAQGLLALRNVVLSPHRGGSTTAAWARAVQVCSDLVIAALNSSAERLVTHRS